MVLFLGTNDLKERYQRSPQQIADAMRDLLEIIDRVALEYGCAFINLGEQITSSKLDGYHLDPESHQKIAALVDEKVRKLVKV